MPLNKETKKPISPLVGECQISTYGSNFKLERTSKFKDTDKNSQSMFGCGGAFNNVHLVGTGCSLSSSKDVAASE